MTTIWRKRKNSLKLMHLFRPLKKQEIPETELLETPQKAQVRLPEPLLLNRLP